MQSLVAPTYKQKSWDMDYQVGYIYKKLYGVTSFLYKPIGSSSCACLLLLTTQFVYLP